MAPERSLAPGLYTAGSNRRYRLHLDLGGRPRGTLWSADEIESGRKVTLRLLPSSKTAGERLGPHPVRAALLASTWVADPRVARVLGYDHLRGGSPVLLMEPLEGETLAARIAREGPPSQNEAVAIAAELADALAAAHRIGIVHGGLGASSVVLSADGIKLIDFGVGSAGRQPDPAGDVHSLGALLGEMLTGGRARPPTPSLSAAAVCRVALAVDPSARPPMKVIASLLREAADENPAAQRAAEHVPAGTPPEEPGGVDLPRRHPSRSRRPLAVMAAAIIGSIALVATMLFLRDDRTADMATRPRTEAPRAAGGSGGAAASGVTVPNLSGVSALEARSRLLALGLRVGGLEPTIGLPGQVVQQDPTPGRIVDPGSFVIMYVGVTPERFAELQASG